ncbi:MAG: response regulator transcription factor [Anaerolineae bacterium]
MRKDKVHEQKQLARVLVVDDELFVSHALAQALRTAGFVADVADNGEEALRMLESFAYAVMILDLSMPGLGGEEVMRIAHTRWPELLIIVLTGHATLESAITAIKSGVVDYIRKPVSTYEAVRVVGRVLRERAERRRRERLVQLIYEALEALYDSPPGGAPVPTDPRNEHFLHVPPLLLDLRRRRLCHEAAPQDLTVDLTESEMRILSVFMSRPNSVLSCRQLVQEALGEQIDAIIAENIVRPVVSRLRAKLGIFSELDVPRIRTVRGRGYFLEVPPYNSSRQL